MRDYTTDPWTDMDDTFIPLGESEDDYNVRCERDRNAGYINYPGMIPGVTEDDFDYGEYDD